MKPNKECKKCGYKWFSRVEEPVSCPKCKNYKWREEKERSDRKTNEPKKSKQQEE